MYSKQITFSLLVAFLLLIQNASSALNALNLTPSSLWYGNDGIWSTVSLRVGTPRQWIDVMVSTASSETWVVSPNGCDGSYKCTNERGGLFDLNKSSTWKEEGFYLLGLDSQLGFNGSGDYGLEAIEFGDSGITLSDSIVGSINTTEYLTGFFGLGIVPGNFSNGQFKSPIGALVESQNTIPSHSYGFTAGATYQQKSEPCSLTLGGYDANRFLPHNISFELNPVQQPEAFLNSISISSSTAPANWTANSLQLLAPADGVYVIFDSSTPFSWLPRPICDQFAQTLGLTYNETLRLYTFDGNPSSHDEIRSLDPSFTFSLSDTSNPSQVVNITLPYAAFDLQLTYPYIPNTTYNDPDATKYYFPLRQAVTENQYTLGRAFLQEAYLITDYERNKFSIHQAVHIADPIGNTSIVDITRPSASKLSPALNVSSRGHDSPGLDTAVIIGITIGVCTGTIVIVILVHLSCRRYNQHRDHSDHCGNSEIHEKGRAQQSSFHRVSNLYEAGSTPTITEMDSTSPQRFELPDSQAPAELESELSTCAVASNPTNVRASERHKEKTGTLLRPQEKSEDDISIEGHHRSQGKPAPKPMSSEARLITTVTSNDSPVSPPPGYSLHSYPSSIRGLNRSLSSSVCFPKLAGSDPAITILEDSMVDTLGSGFTEDEDIRMGNHRNLELWCGTRNVRSDSVTLRDNVHVVHVPVIAEYRFSWEESGEENRTVIGNELVRNT